MVLLLFIAELLKGKGLFSSFRDNGIGLGGESFSCGFYNLFLFGNYDNIDGNFFIYSPYFNDENIVDGAYFY